MPGGKPNRDEAGDSIGGTVHVWTGSTASGDAHGDNCNNWRSISAGRYGDANNKNFGMIRCRHYLLSHVQ